jgi:hypothetical protein
MFVDPKVQPDLVVNLRGDFLRGQGFNMRQSSLINKTYQALVRVTPFTARQMFLRSKAHRTVEGRPCLLGRLINRWTCLANMTFARKAVSKPAHHGRFVSSTFSCGNPLASYAGPLIPFSLVYNVHGMLWLNLSWQLTMWHGK